MAKSTSKPTIPKANPSTSSASKSKKPVSGTKNSSSSTNRGASTSNPTTKNKSKESSKKIDQSTKKSDGTSKNKSNQNSKKSNQNSQKSIQKSQKSDRISKESKPSNHCNSKSSNNGKDKSTVKPTSKVSNMIRNIFYCNSCMNQPTKKTITKTHPSHPQHPLEKIAREHYSFKCYGCKMRGVGDRYACKQCKYNLHVDCASTRSTIKFQGQKCKFLERPNGLRNCEACGMTVEGFVYHCEKNNTDFHPSCTNLKDQIRIQDVIFKLEKKVSSKCLRCQKRNLKGTSKNIRGWSYVSSLNGYKIHVHCLMDMAVLLSSATTTNGDKNGASSSSSSAVQKMNISLNTMIKGGIRNSIGGDKWIKVLEMFLKAILPLLMGAHPAIFVLSLAAIGVKELAEFLI